MVSFNEKSFGDLEELDLQTVDSYLHEILRVFNELATDKEDIPDADKKVIRTIEKKICVLQSALEKDAVGHAGHSFFDVEDPIDYVAQTGHRDIRKEIREIDIGWLASSE